MAKKKFDRTNKINVKSLGKLSSEHKTTTLVAALKIRGLDESIADQVVDWSEIEMVNGDHIIYGIDEISLILELYGKDSDIYKAMAEGKEISSLVEKSLKNNETKIKIEKTLLAKCIEREERKDLSL